MQKYLQKKIQVQKVLDAGNIMLYNQNTKETHLLNGVAALIYNASDNRTRDEAYRAYRGQVNLQVTGFAEAEMARDFNETVDELLQKGVLELREPQMLYKPPGCMGEQFAKRTTSPTVITLGANDVRKMAVQGQNPAPIQFSPTGITLFGANTSPDTGHDTNPWTNPHTDQHTNPWTWPSTDYATQPGTWPIGSDPATTPATTPWTAPNTGWWPGWHPDADWCGRPNRPSTHPCTWPWCHICFPNTWPWPIDPPATEHPGPCPFCGSKDCSGHCMLILLVSHIAQTRNNWCGPAVTIQALTFLDNNASGITQAQLASGWGISNGGGVDLAQISNAIRVHSSDSVRYTPQRLTTQTVIAENIANSLQDGIPPIIRIETVADWPYQVGSGHFLMVTGFNTVTGEVKLTDPWASSSFNNTGVNGVYHVDIELLTRAMSSSRRGFNELNFAA